MFVYLTCIKPLRKLLEKKNSLHYLSKRALFFLPLQRNSSVIKRFFVKAYIFVTKTKAETE